MLRLSEGAVNGIVTLELPCGQKIASTMTLESIKNLCLKPGVEAIAIIKGASVMMAVE